MKTLKKTCWISLAAALAGTAMAGALAAPATNAPPASTFTESTTLDDYLTHAALNNTGLRAAFSRWKAELERIPQAKALPDPRFNYTYYIEEVETRVGPQEQKFGLTQALPWFGTLGLRGEAASEAAEAARQSYEKAKLELFYRVKAAYYEYWYLAQAVAVTKEHVRLVASMEEVARTRYTVGAATQASIIQAQVEQGKLDDRLRTLEALREPIVGRLNAALGRDWHLPIPWPRSLPEFIASFTDEQAQQWLGESNPDLRRLDHLAGKEEAGIRLARKNYYPDISLGVDYIDTGDALNPDMAGSGKDPVMATVSVNLPIWHGKYRAAEREARLRKVAIEEDRDDTENHLGADLKLTVYQLRDAERKIDLYRDTLVPKATQSLQVTRQAFEAGKAGFIELIDAQRSLLEFQLAQQRTAADRGQRLAEVEMLTGREIGGVTE